jgi:hypothetical protein
MPSHVVSEQRFPKVYAWISRFRAALEEAGSSAPTTVQLDGNEAVDFIISSSLEEAQGGVNSDDPLGLEQGTEVEMYPTDWGSEHRDAGQLVALTQDEVTVAARSRDAAELRIHAPRTGFRVTEIGRRAAVGSSTKV